MFSDKQWANVESKFVIKAKQLLTPFSCYWTRKIMLPEGLSNDFVLKKKLKVAVTRISITVAKKVYPCGFLLTISKYCVGNVKH